MRCQSSKKMRDSRETADVTGRNVSMHVAASAMGLARIYIVSGSFGTRSLSKSLRQEFVSCETHPIAWHSSLAVTSDVINRRGVGPGKHGQRAIPSATANGILRAIHPAKFAMLVLRLWLHLSHHDIETYGDFGLTIETGSSPLTSSQTR